MTPDKIERIIYLWFRKKMKIEEIAYLMQVTGHQVIDIIENEKDAIQPSWRKEAPPLSPILKAV